MSVSEKDKTLIGVVIFSTLLAAGIAAKYDLIPVKRMLAGFNKAQTKESAPVADYHYTVEPPFDISDYAVGKEIAGMKVTTTSDFYRRREADAYSYYVQFDGRVTLSGEFDYYYEATAGDAVLYFTPSASEKGKIPIMPFYPPDPTIIIGVGKDNPLGLSGKEDIKGDATITIDSLVYEKDLMDYGGYLGLATAPPHAIVEKVVEKNVHEDKALFNPLTAKPGAKYGDVYLESVRPYLGSDGATIENFVARFRGEIALTGRYGYSSCEACGTGDELGLGFMFLVRENKNLPHMSRQEEVGFMVGKPSAETAKALGLEAGKSTMGRAIVVLEDISYVVAPTEGTDNAKLVKVISAQPDSAE